MHNNIIHYRCLVIIYKLQCVCAQFHWGLLVCLCVSVPVWNIAPGSCPSHRNKSQGADQEERRGQEARRDLLALGSFHQEGSKWKPRLASLVMAEMHGKHSYAPNPDQQPNPNLWWSSYSDWPIDPAQRTCGQGIKNCACVAYTGLARKLCALCKSHWLLHHELCMCYKHNKASIY